MSVDDVEDMYRLLAIAKYDDRYVIPKAHAELADAADGAAGHLRPRLRGRPRQLRRDRPTTHGRRRTRLHAHRGRPGRARHRADAGDRRRERRERRTDGRVADAPRTRSATVYKLCSLLLQYPDDELLAARDELAAAVRDAAALARPPRRSSASWPGGRHDRPARARAALRRDDRPAQALGAVPDLLRRTATSASADRRCCACKQLYRAAGLPLEGTELPDYLPVMLEFAAAAPGRARRDRAARAPRRARAGPPQPARARAARTPALLDAVCQTLGGASAARRDRVAPARRRGPAAASWSGSSRSLRPR